MSKDKRGFASMTLEQRRAIASKGGKSVPSNKRSFSQNPQLAAEAGRKGGQGSSSRKKAVTVEPTRS